MPSTPRRTIAKPASAQAAVDEGRPPAEQDEESRRARESFIDWILNGTGPRVVVDAADEVKRLGLIANYEE